jgi:hypothetical protein
MIPDDPRSLLPGHVTGALNRTESDRLMAGALADQDLFDKLMEAEPVRQALADPVFRRSLRAELREKRLAEGVPFGERLRRFLFQPMVIPAATLALTLMVVFLVKQGALEPDSTVVQLAIPPGGGPVLRAAGFIEVREGEPARLEQVRQQPPQRRAQGGAIGLDQPGDSPTYKVGDAMRLGFRLPDDANIMVTEDRADGSTVRLFPNVFHSSSFVRGGEEIIIPPAGQGQLSVSGPPGRRVLKVLVFPPNIDPMDFSQPWDRIQQQATVLTKTYEVAP